MDFPGEMRAASYFSFARSSGLDRDQSSRMPDQEESISGVVVNRVRAGRPHDSRRGRRRY